MPQDLLTIVIVAGGAGLASLLGGAIALWKKPTTLFMSLALGYASGVLLATISLKMLPQVLVSGDHVVGPSCADDPAGRLTQANQRGRSDYVAGFGVLVRGGEARLPGQPGV